MTHNNTKNESPLLREVDFFPEQQSIGKWTKIFVDDQNNRVYSSSASMSANELLLVFKGRNNKIFLSDSVNVRKFKFSVNGNSNKIFVGSNSLLVGAANVTGKRQNLVIGDNTTFQSVSLYLKEDCNIYIGADCMFSSRIEIRTSDSHAIYDRETAIRVNKPGDVVIGDHVWLGKDVIVSKGVTIPDNCVIGAKSFVNKSLSTNHSIYAGIPARLIRSNIIWTRESSAK